MLGAIVIAIAGAAAPLSAATPKPAAKPRPAVKPRAILNRVNPMEWNAYAAGTRGGASEIPLWPAVRVLSASGADSLFVFPARAPAAGLLAAWPREDPITHGVRIFPRYRWIVVEREASPDSAPYGYGFRNAKFYAANGSLSWESGTPSAIAPLGRNLVLWPLPARADSIPPLVRVFRLPEAEAHATWPAIAGWGASSPLENFLAVNTVGLHDPATGMREDELRLLDLEGRVQWVRTVTADQREFAVSNFGDVAIARDKLLRVYDRAGGEKLRVPLTENVVGRTAITPNGRYVLVAAKSPIRKRGRGDLAVRLYETAGGRLVWNRRDLGGGSAADALELSLSDDGRRALIRLSTGPVLLLGRDGATLATWNLERVSRGEYDAGVVPRRTWISGDGSLVAFTTPVARSLAEARGWLFHVPR